MTRLADITADYLNGQIAAGVQAVQLFDSWVGALSPADYRDFVLPHSRRVIAALRPGVPVIHFGVGTGGLLPLMKAAGGDVIGLDWRVELGPTWARLGHDVAVQGNLDPAVLLAGVPAIRRAAREILDAAAGRPGHVFNLGPRHPQGHAGRAREGPRGHRPRAVRAMSRRSAPSPDLSRGRGHRFGPAHRLRRAGAPGGRAPVSPARHRGPPYPARAPRGGRASLRPDGRALAAQRTDARARPRACARRSPPAGARCRSGSACGTGSRSCTRPWPR